MSDTVAVLLYPGCVFFEIALAAEILAGRFRVRYYSPAGEPHTASNGATVAADGSYAELTRARTAAVLVPGGDPGSIMVPNALASAALQAQAAAGSLMAGICAGNLVLAAAGLLRGRRGTHNYTAEYAPPQAVEATAPHWQGLRFVRADLVEDGPIITAQPWAYRQYAAAVARRLGVIGVDEASDLISYPTRLRRDGSPACDASQPTPSGGAATSAAGQSDGAA